MLRDGTRKVFHAPAAAKYAHRLSSPNVADRRDVFSGNEIAADHLVPGNLSDQPGQDGAVGFGAWIQPVDATDWLNRSAGVS